MVYLFSGDGHDL